MKSPKLDEPVTEPLTEAELKVALRYRRDEAMVWLMIGSGVRAGELVALELGDLDWRTVRPSSARGRAAGGAASRSVPRPRWPWPATRGYDAGTGSLTARQCGWGTGARGYTYNALHKTLREGADAAALVGFHPHQMRHTWAHRWLSAGGSESGAMPVGGWTRPDMLRR